MGHLCGRLKCQLPVKFAYYSNGSDEPGLTLLNNGIIFHLFFFQENQRLRSELDDVKLNGVREQSDKLLQLEQEVKRKDLTLKQVEAERSKDTNHYVAIEKDLHASNNKVQQLEQVKCWKQQSFAFHNSLI